MDLKKVPPIQQKRIIEFVNNFVINTVSFLNKFANDSEIRLQQLDVKLKRVEAELSILEYKLNSVPSLKSCVSTKSIADISQVQQSPSIPRASNIPSIPSTNHSDENHVENDAFSINEETNSNTDSTIEPKPKEIPEELKKFFKMVQFGVPVQAVKLKMKTEGFDPALLES